MMERRGQEDQKRDEYVLADDKRTVGVSEEDIGVKVQD